MRIERMVLCVGMLVMCTTTVAFGQQSLGTSASLEWLRNPKSRDAERPGPGKIATPPEDRIVTLAEEPVPAFRYRFWPSKTALKPGSAQMHFYRAVVSYQSVLQWNQAQSQQLQAIIGLDIGEITASDASPWIERMKTVFDELEMMANSEDFAWDFRFRDKQGKDIWMTQLEEVQQARNLARLLHLKLVVHLAKQEHDAAVDTLRTGFRLASFVGQGESLIQTLVGIAIEHTMYNAVEYAIRTPGFPNMYWAFRTLPPQLSNVDTAVETELEMAMRTLSVLSEDDIIPLSDSEILSRFRTGLRDLRSLGSNSEGGVGAPEMMAAIMVASGSDAKRKLQSAGYNSERLAKLTDLQASLIHSGLELRKQRDALLKASKIGGVAGIQVGNKVAQEFDAWAQANRWTVAGLVSSMLFPAINNVVEANLRTRLWRNRLTAVEALRSYAATHDGKLPTNLESLADTPVPFDPYTEQPFAVQITQEGETQVVRITSDVPSLQESLRTLTIRFPLSR